MQHKRLAAGAAAVFVESRNHLLHSILVVIQCVYREAWVEGIIRIVSDRTRIICTIYTINLWRPVYVGAHVVVLQEYVLLPYVCVGKRDPTRILGSGA